MGLFDELLGSVVKVASSAFLPDPNKVTRRDWDRVRLLEAQANEEQRIAASRLADGRSVSFGPSPSTAPVASGGGMPWGSANGAPKIGPPAGTGAQDRAGEALVNLIWYADQGYSDGALRSEARKLRFSYKDFSTITRDTTRMNGVWFVLQQRTGRAAYSDPNQHGYRAWLLDKVNDALVAQRARRSRGVGLKTLKRAAREAQKLARALPFLRGRVGRCPPRGQR